MWFFSLFSGDDDLHDRHSLELYRQFRALRWLLALFALLVLAPRILNLYVDSLWFDSLRLAPVFWLEWRAKVLIFTAFFLLTFLALKSAFGLLERIFGKYSLGGALPRFDGNALQIAPQRFMRPLGWGISLAWALLIGAGMSARWELFALFWNQVPVAQRDPIFNKPLNFYLFSWPVWQMVVSWLFGLTMLIFLAAALWSLMAFISKLPRIAQEKARRTAYLATAFSLAGVLLTWAARLYLARFSLLWKSNEIYTGIGYVQANITLPANALLMAVLPLCAALAIWNALRARSLKVFVTCLALPFAISMIAGLAANYVSNFVVKPNQLALETPFIKHNIAATREAFALNRIAARDFPAEGDIEAIQIGAKQTASKISGAASAGTPLDNVRLWDWRALQATLTQTQALRTYYEFPDVDVDRYVVNGRARQVMISARELNAGRLPETSRNWINEKLIYTHGYGVVMNTASEFTPEGRPRFLVSDMPLKFNAPEIKVSRPEIYFGQLTHSHVYVKTGQREFNFPRGGKDSLSTYEGNGGIALGGFFRRTALAWALGDLSKIPFSNAVTPDTRVLLYRQINERASRIAPFLKLDEDPYIVVDKSGRLKWMLDAYTTTLYRPYSTHFRMGNDLGNNWANYARNSVKIVVDAYEGTVDFYVFEPNDPIIQTWRKIYPSLFKNAEEMPADLREHVRYPETLFRAQSEVYGLYHTTDPSTFFSRNDLWSVARLADNDNPGEPLTFAPGAGFPTPGVPGAMPLPNAAPGQFGSGRNLEHSIEPYFLLGQLPLSGGEEEFLLSVPFTSTGKTSNLTGWLAARSDGENYGQLALYEIPQTRNILAPQQIRANIAVDPQLSGQITLWNQQKSSILWGNLLVLPIGRGLLYVQPIFLQSTASPLPVLRLVVLATQDKIFYAPTYQEALEKLLGESAPAPPEPAPTRKGSTPSASGGNRRQLIERAARDLADYQSLTSQGKYAEAGAKLESLRKNLEELKSAR